MKIGSITLEHPVALAPMAGMTDTAFRRLVKRRGGCGLVVTEMVSSEGLVRGIDRTLEYAEYTEEERPVSIQIFGGDPVKMADAAQIVEGMGADVVDINMGCPVPKIAKHNAGCSLMREPEHAASVVRAMARAVRIPVTVKMRAGWNEREVNAPELARMVEDAGAAAIAVHGRTAAQSYTGESDWALIARVAGSIKIPVFGSGDCVEPDHVVSRLGSNAIGGVLVGRGALRNPWIFQQAASRGARRPPHPVNKETRRHVLVD
jgi:nifR3 family TIM-barrel protein